MKKNFTIIFAILLSLFYTRGNAQTQFWSDTFEDTGAPSSGIRVPSVAEFTFGGPPPTAYFFRTIPTGINLQAGSYTGFEGAKVWAAEDIDKSASGVNGTINPNQQVTWPTINIVGKSGLSFKGLFAANNFNAGWNGTSAAPFQDFIAIEYRIDGGAWTKIIAFYAGLATSTNALSLDTNGDLIGDGASLGYAFSEFSANIPGTGALLEIRLNCSANGSDSQEFAVDNFRLFETPACTAPVITANPPNRSLCPGSNTTFTASATGATAYKWQVDQTGTGTYTDLLNVAPYSGVTTNTLTITGATTAMHSYRYRAVAINGIATCFANSNPGTLSVSNITLASSQDNILCAGSATGSASVIPSGGIGTYTYSWSPSGGTGSIASNLSAGTYTVTVKDFILCETSKTFIITDTAIPILISPSQTNVSCNGGSNGTATALVTGGTGLGTYTYSWSHSNLITTATASGLSAGTYTVTVTDANNCSKQQVFNIIAPTVIVTSVAGQTNVSCNGLSNGSATVGATGGTGPGTYTYSWSPSGGTAATASGLTAGLYTVTVTDGNNCSKQQVFNIIAPTAIVTSVAGQTNVSCNGLSNGSATVGVTGGTGPGTYTYSWSPSGGTAATASGLTAGLYTVTVTDGNNCSKQQVFNIIAPTAIVTSVAGQTNVSCNGLSNGSATVGATGGTGPGTYTYSWSPSGGTAATASGLTAGLYTVTVTDANNCTKDQIVNIVAPPAIVTSNAGQTNVTCNGGANGSATVGVTGGTGAGTYTYSWSPSGGTAATASGLTVGTYTVTVTDANSCSETEEFTITEPIASILSITRAGNILTADQAGATYQWFTCPNTDIVGEIGQTFTPTANGSYGVAITLNGCTVIAPCVNVTNLATKDFEEKSKFVIYPNPSQGIVNVKSDHDADLSIINQSGQIVKTVKVTADNTNSINVENLSDGIYFIRETKGNKPYTYKLILKK